MPKKLLVVGSGAIGVEFASFYNALGAETTLIEVLDKILPQEDEEISGIVKKEFVNKGIKVQENSVIQKTSISDTMISVDFNCNGDEYSADFDTIILATGITGNIEGLGIEKLNIISSNGHIETNEYCQTNVENVFAIGDIAGPPWLAHKASHEGVMVAEYICGESVRALPKLGIPGCTFCTPQIASVGLTEEQAKSSGNKVRVGRFPFVANGKALTINESVGLVKTIYDSESGELLGAHLVGAEVTELIHSYAMCKQLEGTDEDIFHTIFPHPTLSEMIHESALDSADRAIHF